jgi:hypothetical protein
VRHRVAERFELAVGALELGGAAGEVVVERDDLLVGLPALADVVQQALVADRATDEMLSA